MNLLKIFAKYVQNCIAEGFLKPQNNAAQFRTMRGRGSLLAARGAHSAGSYSLIFLEITQKHFGHQTQKT